jgi:periplasmic divalent cation tolerance protein
MYYAACALLLVISVVISHYYYNIETGSMLSGAGVKLMYMTAPTREVAGQIAKALVLEKLAACVNIIGQAESFYMWEGKLENSQEVVMLAKAIDTDAVIKRVKSLHPYEIPCIISLPVNAGDNQFINWVKESCAASNGNNLLSLNDDTASSHHLSSVSSIIGNNADEISADKIVDGK